jgi:multisubunit Na+/H+ antiporter MnhE subunit
MFHILGPLFVIGLIIWVIKTQRYSDGLFLLTVAVSARTFLGGAELLGPLHPEAKWQGVALVAVSLVVMLVAAIAFKVLGQRASQQPQKAPESSNIAEQVETQQPPLADSSSTSTLS